MPQRGIEPQPLAIQLSIIPLDHRDTDPCHTGNVCLLPPANEVCEGNVFTDVYLTTGGSRSVSGGSLSRGVSVQGDPPVRQRVGGKHPTGMHSSL